VLARSHAPDRRRRDARALTPAARGALWKSTQALHLRHHALLAIAGIVVALAVVAILSAVLRSRPRLLALCAVVALPFRFSLISGGPVASCSCSTS